MLVEELVARLDSGQYSFEDQVCVEVNGILHDIQDIRSTPTGMILVVDSFEEERALRQVTLETLEGDCDG